MNTPFGTRLRNAMDDRGPVCVGIDPHAALLDAWGMTDSVNGLEKFALSATEAIAPRVSVIKPQSAFYERFGSQGIAVLERVIRTAREAGCLVLLDVKRGDIGSTAQAYADAYLDPNSPICVDAITASPYLGFGSLTPMVETALAHGGGVFVLALTSNPEGPQVQHARTGSGATVGASILGEVARLNAGADPLGSVGVVVGATIEPQDEDFEVNGPILMPGIGAQGGTVDDVRRILGEAARHVLPSVSREILAAGPDSTALVEAVKRQQEAFAGLASGAR